MSLLDTILRVTAHPAAQPFLQRVLNGDPQEREQRRLAELRQALAESRAIGAAGATATLAAGSTASVSSSPVPQALPDLAPVRDQLILISGALKESLRFAREDGLDHPEVQKRLADSQQWAVDLERFQLRPEALARMDPATRRQAEALLVPLRRLRQQLGEAGSVPALTDASAYAGQLASSAQIGAALGTMPPLPAAPAAPNVYSQYAPDMTVDTSCLACSRSHFAGVQGALEAAAQEAATKGFGDRDVQERLGMAQEELAALLAYDLTPDQIAKSPPAEQAAVQPIVPAAHALLTRLRNAQSPADLRAAAVEAQTIRQQVAVAPATSTTFTSLVTETGPRSTEPGTPRVNPQRAWYTDIDPTATQVRAIAPAFDTRTAFDNLERALEARGVHVRVRQLPATDQSIIEGQYETGTNAVLLAPFVLSKDSYADQTLIHEATHVLLHGSACLPNPPKNHGPQEAQAEAGTIITMTESGLPIETREGTIIPPGSREVDWTLLASEVGQPTADNLRWASQWILDAMRGTLPADRLHEICPIPAVSAAGPSVTLGQALPPATYEQRPDRAYFVYYDEGEGLYLVDYATPDHPLRRIVTGGPYDEEFDAWREAGRFNGKLEALFPLKGRTS